MSEIHDLGLVKKIDELVKYYTRVLMGTGECILSITVAELLNGKEDRLRNLLCFVEVMNGELQAHRIIQSFGKEATAHDTRFGALLPMQRVLLGRLNDQKLRVKSIQVGHSYPISNMHEMEF